jgi:mannosyl-3-phosphoglycerate synthase
VAQGVLAAGEQPPRERVYPPVGTLALDLLYDALDAEARSSGSTTGGPPPA